MQPGNTYEGRRYSHRDFSLTATVQSRNFHASSITHLFNINKLVFIISIFSTSGGH